MIEITDPDCSFCRKASEYFKTRKDVTRYVFLYPLSIHATAEAKIRYIFCAKDRVKAYEEAMTGKLDDMKFKPCDDAAVTQLAKTHKEICERLGISEMGTPFFLIDEPGCQGCQHTPDRKDPRRRQEVGGRRRTLAGFDQSGSRAPDRTSALHGTAVRPATMKGDHKAC